MTLLARILLALYPRDVRDRYGEEIADLLRHSRLPWRDAADVAWCALIERRRSTAPWSRSVNEPFALLLLAPPLALVLSYAYRSRRPAPITA